MNASDVRDIYADIESLVKPKPVETPIEVPVDKIYRTVHLDSSDPEKFDYVKFTPRQPLNLFEGISNWTWFWVAFLSGCWLSVEIVSAYLMRLQ